MKLVEALKIIKMKKSAKPKHSVFLACGFEPLHLATFLNAHLTVALPELAISIETGLFGDMTGNLQRISKTKPAMGVVCFEWADFDARLGLRALGGWGPSQWEDISAIVETKSDQYQTLLCSVSEVIPLVISLPTLAMPPLSFHSFPRAATICLNIKRKISSLACKLSECRRIKVLNQEYIDTLYPLAGRQDVRAVLASGFPYTLAYASKLSESFARLVQPSPSKKGLITDLDQTLWRGVVGDDGVDGVRWDLDSKAHIHALYQQTLAALSECGTLIAIASKNSPELVGDAFARKDFLLPLEKVFPLEIGWGKKSESVGRILKTWNIGAESVVVIDDNPFELEEVKSEFPEITTLQFPTLDDEAGYKMLFELRDLFGKDFVSGEDALRVPSLRNRGRTGFPNDSTNDERLISGLQAVITFQRIGPIGDDRALELLNKTNQFNLNGHRFTQGELSLFLRDLNSFGMTIGYRDKFGPLGKIGVILGSKTGEAVIVDAWVMSCRAFSRRIEIACLDFLFTECKAKTIIFSYKKTERNKPFEEFLQRVNVIFSENRYSLMSDNFMRVRQKTYHTIEDHE